MKQLSLDFLSLRPTGKKIERIPIACTEDLKFFVTEYARRRGVSVSEVCEKWIVEGVKRDIGELLISQTLNNPEAIFVNLAK